MPSTRSASGANRPPKWSPPGSGAYSSMEICEIGSPPPSASDRRRVREGADGLVPWERALHRRPVDPAVIPSKDGGLVLEPREDDFLAARGARRLHAEATLDRCKARNEIGQLHSRTLRFAIGLTGINPPARESPGIARAYAGTKAKKARALGGP